MDTLSAVSRAQAGIDARRRALAGGLAVVFAVALVKLVLHLATTGLFGYGYFVDELYFLACAEHLAWGYVDMPPLFPALTALIRSVLGDSLLAVRDLEEHRFLRSVLTWSRRYRAKAEGLF